MTKNRFLAALALAVALASAPLARAANSVTLPDGTPVPVAFPGGYAPLFATMQLGGNSGGFDKLAQSAPTVANSAHTYTSATNAVSIGGLQTVAVFRTTTQPSGLLTYAQALSKAGNTTGLTIYGWSRNPTHSTCTDAAQFVHDTTSSATPDAAYLLPGFPVTITPAAGSGSATPTVGAASFSPPISVSNLDAAPTANLYFCVLGNGTTTPAANDYVFTYSIIQD